MALGDILRKARESRKLTASEVAAATHMKVQTVEAIEREDFSRMPAAIYCKGFIKLYAEHLGMNPDPLTREYVERFVEPPPQPEPEPEPEPGKFHVGFHKKDHQDEAKPDEEPVQEEEEERDDHLDLFSFGATRKEDPPEKLFDHTPPPKEEEPPSPAAGEQIKEHLSKFSSKVSDAAGSLKENLTARIKSIREKKENAAAAESTETIGIEPDPEVDVSPITMPNRQILIITGAVAGAILLIFLLSVAARFFTGDEQAEHPETADEELVLPVPPPPPYID